MIPKTLLTVAAALSATFVSAISISPPCETALESIIASPDAACLDGSALLSLFIQGNTSIIQPINNWLTGLCALPPCTNATLAAVVTNITTGCSTDLASLGLSPNDTSSADIIPAVQAAYPAFRQVLCLKDTTTNTLCVTETLTNIQNLAGTLSLDNLGSVVAKLTSLTSLPTNITCTDCIKEAFNILEKELPSQVTDFAGPFQSQCGASFTDGQTPSDVMDLASGASTGAALGAVSLLSRGALTGIALSMLLVVSSAVALLA